MYDSEFKPRKMIMSGPVLSNPAIKDIDDDGKNEIIIKDSTGKVHVSDNLDFGENTQKPGFPIIKERSFFSSSINVTDVTNNQNDEIINDLGNGIVEIYNSSGTIISSLNININNDPDEISSLYHKPLVIDVDKDGENNIVFITNDGKLFVCDKNLQPMENYPKKVAKYCFEAPQILDIDNDGELDIIFSGWSEGEEFNPIEKSGFITALDLNGNTKDNFPIYIGKSSSPLTIADIDQNGKLEILVGTGVGYSGKKLVVINTEARIPISIVEIGAKYLFSNEE
jgi:predicted transcriptional regulator